MSFTGTEAGDTVRVGTSIADITAGLFGLIGAGMALESRHKSGRGQFVDVAMLDTLLSTMAPTIANLFGSGHVPRPLGTKLGTIVPYRTFGCRDRAKSERFFSDLFGWHMQQNGPGTTIDTASQQGIGGHMTSLGHEPFHYTIFYVEVDDVKAYLDKAVALGGKMVVPPVKIPTGTFAWFSDIDGNTIGLLKTER